MQKVRPFSQPVGPHGAAQVHAVDAGAEIVRQGGAVHRIRQPGQLPEAGAVQHKIALLTIAGLRQSLTGLLYGLCRLDREEVPQLPLPVVRQQLLRVPSASCHQQAAAVLAPALYQYLQIVIVRGQPENVQDPCIGHILAQTGEQILPPPAHGLIQRRLRLRVKGGPAHLLQHTGRIPVRRSRQQLLPALRGQQPGLPAVDTGAEIQIFRIMILLGQRAAPSQSNRMAATSPDISCRSCRRISGKVQLHSTLPCLRISPPPVGRCSADRRKCPP